MTRRFSRLVSRSAIIFVLVALCSAAISAQQSPLASIHYRLTMPRPASHLFGVSIEVALPEGVAADYLDFQMPRWSPGRYAVFDFAKNVQEVQAAAGICPPPGRCDMAMRPVTRLDDQTWRVRLNGSKSLTFTYKVFGDDLSGTFSQLDERHATFNGGSVFMYIVGHKPDPVKLSVDPPKGWRVVNGASASMDQREFSFPNYDILIDTPTEVSPDWTMDEFKVDGKTYRVVVHSLGNEGGKRPQLVRDLEKIVRAETRMWGAPEFDTYTFLFHFAADDHSGDGMEHLVSTNIIQPGALGDPGMYEETLEAAAHEFFHVWNVKRLRPAELGPWDFTRPANTRGLWIAEGVTEYYGELMLRRAGLWDDAKAFERFAEVITGIENRPGARLMSAEESSLIAPFMDGGQDVQRTNMPNTTVNYYYKGEVVAIVLDLILRGRTNGRSSLDDVLRRAYEELYLKSPNATYYLKGRGYTSEDFERITSEVAGTDMSDFFKRYVRGVEVPPYDEAFRTVGLRFVRETSSAPAVGLTWDFAEQKMLKVASVRSDSPAESAGLEQGDIITAIGRQNVTTETFQPIIARFKPNDRITLTVRRDRNTLKKTVTLGQPATYTFHLEEMKDATPEMRARRAAWLSGGK